MATPGAGVPTEADLDREQAAWLRRPFARTFDLIAAEYGWTDDQILDLTMERIAQIRTVIRERQNEDRRRDLTVREKELQTLVAHIRGAAGDRNARKAADSVRLVPPNSDPVTGKPKREIRPIPFEQARRWFPEHE